MAAGVEFLTYRKNLSDLIDFAEAMRALFFDLGVGLKIAEKVVDKLAKGSDDVEDIADTISDAESVLSLTKQAGPLRAPSNALDKSLKSVSPVIDKFRADMKKLSETKDKDGDGSEEDNGFLKILAEALGDASSAAFTESAKLYSQGVILQNDLAAVDQMIEALNARPFALDSTTDFSELLSVQSALSGALDQQASLRNAKMDEITFDYLTLREKLEGLQDMLDDIEFKKIDAELADLEVIDAVTDALSGPLDAAAALLTPVQPLLDKAGAAIDLVLGPIFDFVTNALGLNKLMDSLTADIRQRLPDIDLLQPLLDLLQVFQDAVDDLATNLFELPAFLRKVGDFQIGDPDEGPTGIGTPRQDRLFGDAGGDVLDARAGDDLIDGGAGNDMIIAGEGDDTVIGGSGVDILRLEGTFEEYELSRNSTTNRVVVTHVTPQRGSQNEGTEEIEGIEYVMFDNITFTGAQLQNAIIGGSILNGTGGSDLMFLNSTGARNAQGFYEANGWAGNDTIFGSTGDDALNGGAGEDVLLGGQGDDLIHGGAGRDTYQVLRGTSTGQRTNLETGRSFGQGQDTLFAIEDIVFGSTGGHQIRGNSADNALVTNGGEDIVTGGNGNDVIVTEDGRDVAMGGNGRDWLQTGKDNDLLIAGGAHQAGPGDIYDGGDGTDMLSYSSDYNPLRDKLTYMAPNDRNVVRAYLDETGTAPGRVRIFAETGKIEKLDASGRVIGTDTAIGIETFVGSDFADILRGHYDVNATYGIDLHGGGGNDTIFADGASEIQGGDGDDLLVLTQKTLDAPGNPDVGGGSGFDTLDLRGLGDVRWRYIQEGSIAASLQAYDSTTLGSINRSFSGPSVQRLTFFDGGIERILFSDASHYIYNRPGGTAQVDFVLGAGDDEIDHLNGRAILRAGDGDDTVRMDSDGEFFGMSGNDRVEVDNASRDVFFFGGIGNDSALVERSSGTFSGGEGFDAISFDPTYSNAVEVDLALGKASGLGRSPVNSSVISVIDVSLSGFEAVVASNANDTLRGDAMDNRLIGRAGRDTIEGRDGRDQLFGGADNDVLRGGNGDDKLHGGAGNDILDGGNGIDTAIYTEEAPNGRDGEVETTSAGGVNADLLTGQVSGGAGRDSLNSIENIFGSSGDDTLTGDNRDNVLSGEDGDDSLVGRGGADLLITGKGRDTILGGDGNDTLDGGDDADLLIGGANFDTIFAGSGDDTVRGDNGRDLILLNQGNDRFEDNAQGGDLGRDTVFGGFGDDTIEGGNGGDEFHGEWGADLINARDGDDRIYGGDQFDTISAGRGNDTVWGGNGRDLIFLNQGNDRFNDNGQGGDLGRDTVFAGFGDDTIEGGNGGDEFHGEWGADLINARDGDDRVYGGDQFDTISAGLGNDTVWSGNGRDLIFLNQGNDRFNDNGQGGDLGSDTVFGGFGNDTIEGGNGGDVFHGEAGDDVIRARKGNDTVYGGDSFDFIDAGEGNDLVFGGNGRDRIFLGAGNDRYIDNTQGGALGQDTVTGGAGADLFVFGTATAADVITDFTVGTDTLQFASALVGGRGAARVVNELATVTGQGVLFDFGAGHSVLLEGLSSTAGLVGDIVLV
ncbi:hypothetical protein [Thalassococcus sp. S3]|uniref:calcium-binding protein n=1 Tax=Thalassococcus sp. S3 TaxID=2017482 RepID=UPI0010242932|nr:hypothetical protein [Thalassococcus sp. S3]QBF33912.1 hypothetical protein CFI11_22240 [Thalassococcus sp. S3]